MMGKDGFSEHCNESKNESRQDWDRDNDNSHEYEQCYEVLPEFEYTPPPPEGDGNLDNDE